MLPTTGGGLSPPPCERQTLPGMRFDKGEEMLSNRLQGEEGMEGIVGKDVV